MWTVDLKMSWASVLPVLLAGYAEGAIDGRRTVQEDGRGC